MIHANDQSQEAMAQQALVALSPYLKSHASANIEVRRRYDIFLHIRIIDPDFKGLDRVDREPEVWRLLETLPDEVCASITMLLLLTPEETRRPGANIEFEDLPSLGAVIGEANCLDEAQASFGFLGNGRGCGEESVPDISCDGRDAVQQIEEAFDEYKKSHPDARVDVQRRSDVSIRIRIINPDFRGMDRVEREPEVRNLLKPLPEDVFECVTMFLLLTPEETRKSLANFEFENPVPSRF